MRVIKTKEKSLFIETDKQPDIVTDFDGTKVYYVHLPPLEEMVKVMPSPLLEDIFQTVNIELQMRDKKWVQENL